MQYLRSELFAFEQLKMCLPLVNYYAIEFYVWILYKFRDNFYLIQTIS